MMLSSRNMSSRSPFTAIQWQELENQALIYKYLVSGVPIPSELITTVRRMLDPSSFSSTILYPHHYHQTIGGWGCFDVGIGGRRADPEPGRCRRTDGKKWRCQKDAYPGSRYCERHIHRGKGKSKKQQQQLLEAAATSASNNNSSTAKAPLRTPYPLSTTTDFDSSCSTRTALFSGEKTGTTSQNHHLLSSDSFGLNNLPNKDYRYFSGMNDSLGERSFFPQDARSTNSSYMLTNNMNSSSSSVGHSNFPFQGYNNRVVDTTTRQEEQQSNQNHHHHSYVLGIESESVRPINLKQEFIHTTTTTNEQQENSQKKKPFHHFFDEWSRNNNSGSNPNGCVGVSWLNDYEEESTAERSGHVSSVPTSTQLSMAIPMASNDLSSPPFSNFHSSS